MVIALGSAGAIGAEIEWTGDRMLGSSAEELVSLAVKSFANSNSGNQQRHP